jgi:hypothetical protein
MGFGMFQRIMIWGIWLGLKGKREVSSRFGVFRSGEWGVSFNRCGEWIFGILHHVRWDKRKIN